MRRALNVTVWCLAVGYIVAVILSGLVQPVAVFDEPIPWVGAMQFQRGLAPHTGFWSTYPPLAYWLLAAVFSMLGETAVAARFLGVAFFLVFLGAVAVFTARNYPPADWRVPYATLLGALGAGPLFIYAFGLGLSACLCSVLVYFILSGTHHGRRPALYLIPGLMLAGTMLLRINFGAYAAFAILLDLILTGEKKRAGFIVGPMILALLLYLLPYGGAMAEVIHQIVTVPQVVFTKTRFIPLPDSPLYYALIALPPAWFALRTSTLQRWRLSLLAPIGAAAAVCVASYLSRSNGALLPGIFLLDVSIVIVFDRYLFRLHRLERGILILFGLFIHYFLWRADEWHLRPLLAIAGLLLPFVLLSFSRISPVFFLLMLVPIAGVFWRLHAFRPHVSSIASTLELMRRGELLDRTSDSARFLGAEPDALRPEWQRLYPDSDELSALRYVYRRTRKDDCVYVGAPDHSNVFVGNIRAYWLLQRCVGVRMHILEPGVSTELRAQAEMAGDLHRKRVRWLILAPAEKGDDAFRRNSIRGAALLDAAIARNYRVAATFGGYSVLGANGF